MFALSFCCGGCCFYASGFQNMQDVIRFLLIFICENIFLLSCPRAIWISLFDGELKEESLGCNAESALSDSVLTVNRLRNPAGRNIVYILHIILKYIHNVSQQLSVIGY